MTQSARHAGIALAATAALLLGAPASALQTDPNRIEPGDTISIYFPTYNDVASTQRMEGVTVEVRGLPTWLRLEDTSMLGPETILAGLKYDFAVDLVVAESFSPTNAGADFQVIIDLGSPDVVPRVLTWTFQSSNGLLTYLGRCVDDAGSDCGGAATPDFTPPISAV